MAADEASLRREVAKLRLELTEAKDALRAIREGEVDALMVDTPQGRRVFTLESAYLPYREFLEHMQQGAAAVSPTGLVLYANHRFSEILGMQPDEMVGQLLTALLSEADCQAVDSLLAKAHSGADCELTFRRPNGSTAHALLTVTPLPDGNRGAVLTDIGERLRQAEILASRESLLEANRAKDEFLATLSHELRTPMNAILGWAQIISTGRLDATTMKRGVDAITRNAQAQMQLITDILDVSRIVSGKLRLEIAPLDFMSVVSAALDAVRPAAEAKGITLETSVSAESVVLPGDADRLQQVVWNLVSNAVKFTGTGGSVQVSITTDESGVVLGVSDTGIGIPRELLPRVFDRFVQADSSTRRNYAGLGLGLSIVRHLVELHGGTVAVASDGEGCGARFTVRLPLRAGVTHGRAAAVAGDRSGQASLCPSLAGLRILVLDDELDAREMLATLLAQQGAVAPTAACSPEALERVATERFDAIVADIGMPGEDGYEFVSKVRRLSPAAAALPVIALTGYGSDQDARRAAASGFDAHLVKPVVLADLASTIARLVRRHPLPPALT